MPPTLGLTFQPTAETVMRKKFNQNGQLAPGAPEVLKIMGLRLPQVLSGKPIAPADLLTGPQRGGTNSALLNTLGIGSGVTTPGSSSRPLNPDGKPSGLAPSTDLSASIVPIGASNPPPRFTSGIDDAGRMSPVPDFGETSGPKAPVEFKGPSASNGQLPNEPIFGTRNLSQEQFANLLFKLLGTQR